MYTVIRPLLFLLPAEAAHHLTLRLLGLANRTGLLSLFRRLAPVTVSTHPISMMGIQFPNRIGLAAGLDKNGEYIDALGKLGFGHIEIGTVTPRPQPGNTAPRLFRLVKEEGIINRMGFNNKGVDYLLEQVKRSRYKGVLGINIGKNFDTPVEKAVDDYLLGMRAVYLYADYIAINISSPNTPGLRTLQYGDELRQLLQALKQEQTLLNEKHARYVPITVKVAPDLDDDEIKNIATVLLQQRIDGLIATNTTLSREGVEENRYAQEKGGLSGKPVMQRSTQVLEKFHAYLQGEIPIIGVGGIASAADAEAKISAGAELIQLYTGLIYQGEALIKEVSKATAETPSKKVS